MRSSSGCSNFSSSANGLRRSSEILQTRHTRGGWGMLPRHRRWGVRRARSACERRSTRGLGHKWIIASTRPYCTHTKTGGVGCGSGSGLGRLVPLDFPDSCRGVRRLLEVRLELLRPLVARERQVQVVPVLVGDAEVEERVHVVRVQKQRALEGVDRLPEAALVLVARAEVVEGHDRLRVHLDSLLIGFHGLAEAVLATRPERVAEVDPRVRIVRVVRRRLVEAIDGLLHAALVLVDVPEVVVRERVVRLQLDGLLVCPDGLGEHLLLAIGAPQVVVRVHVQRILCDRVLVAQDRLVQLAAVLQRRACVWGGFR
mmetsp:Transcript_42404/g.132944  ORF Transcript_42404/g.132944 Transcript_42404/m.132944 type:complete len:314 (+) Transcript_42404:172-1113(+)